MGETDAMFVIHLRRARSRARTAAAAEAIALMRGLGASVARGGPLAEHGGIAWIRVPERNAAAACGRLKRLGYIEAVDLVRSLAEAGAGARKIRWKGRDCTLVSVYREPDENLRDAAPDRREFLLECPDGVVRKIAGYRGGEGALEHRALPVADARMLVNLVFAPERGTLLDPFAGIGGIAIEARASGWNVVSLDIDPSLRFGLRELACHHAVASAAALPLASGSIDAIATEPPYHPSALSAVVASIGEMARVTRAGGRIAILAGADQAPAIRGAAAAAGLRAELDEQIDRKGTSVVCLCWEKPARPS